MENKEASERTLILIYFMTNVVKEQQMLNGTCVNANWNNSSFNTLLENGGSLYGVGSGNALDCSNPLNNTACSGYDAAYLTPTM